MRIVVDEDGWVLESDEPETKAEKGSPGSGVYPKASRAAETDEVVIAVAIDSTAIDCTATDFAATDFAATDFAATDFAATDFAATDPAPPFEPDGDGCEIPPPASIPRDIAAWAGESDCAAQRAKSRGRPRVA